MTVRERPAETSGVAGAAALLVGRVAGIEDADVIVALAVVLGCVPAVVTWFVSRRPRRRPRRPAVMEGGQ